MRRRRESSAPGRIVFRQKHWSRRCASIADSARRNRPGTTGKCYRPQTLKRWPCAAALEHNSATRARILLLCRTAKSRSESSVRSFKATSTRHRFRSCRRRPRWWRCALPIRSEEHTSELQSPCNLVCRLLLEKKKLHHYLSTFGQQGSPADHIFHFADVGFPEGIQKSFDHVGRKRTDITSKFSFFFFNNRAPPEFNTFPPPAPLRI